MLSGDMVMSYFDPHRKNKLKTNVGPQERGTMKQYDLKTAMSDKSS